MGASGRKKTSKSRTKGGARRRTSSSPRKSKRRVYKRSPNVLSKMKRGIRRRVNAVKRWRWQAYARASYWVAVLAIWALMGVGGIAFYFAMDLPDTSTLWTVNHRPSITLIDRRGETIATHGLSYGLPVTIEDLPPYVPQAVLAIEDRRFYHHIGIDAIGLARAAVANWQAGRIVQGGSTITQQLAKNLFLTPERNIKRKIQEVMLALWLEQRFTKDQILSLYLNRVYLGAGAYGIDAASTRYFGKTAARVTLSEAALLAGLLKAPSRYSPTNSKRLSQERTELVLDKMVEVGFLTPLERARADQTPPRLAQPSSTKNVNYFVDWIVDQIPDYIGETNADLVVETTLDMNVQRQAEKALELSLARDGKALNVSEGAVLTLSPQGEVRAMIGGRSYRYSQYNRVTQARRQPGSAFKPFVYLSAIEDGLTPQSLVEDAPIRIGNWSPKNFSKTYRGRITLQEALAHSVNTAAVRLAQDVGSSAIVRTAERLGVLSPLTANRSLALGTSEVTMLELVAAYAVFANGGRFVAPHGLTRIATKDGAVLYERENYVQPVILSLGDVAAMNDMLRETVRVGTGRRAQLTGRPVAGKTGTSQDSRDAWFIGYTADLVTGVWVGNDNFSPMKNVTGGRVPAIIWRDIMQPAQAVYAVRDLPGTGASRIARTDRDGNAVSRFFSRVLNGFGPDNVNATP